MKKLRSLKILNDHGRISSVDIFRSLAIITVVLYHFNGFLPYGYLGVDLFFVISGLLVGGLLTKDLKEGKKINFLKFFLQRGFKIWPSYYIFLLFGSIMAYGFYHSTNPEQLISPGDSMRYIFFYQNYTGAPFHWSFDHVWSLCVEEHFYILLPILFLMIQYFIQNKYRVRVLFVLVIATILAGIAFKYVSYFFTNSQDTYAGTHNRIDALAWGVLLNLIVTRYGEKLQTIKFKVITFVSGLIVFSGALYFLTISNNILFHKIYFHSIAPFSFFLMLMGTYFVDFSSLKPLRFIAYYSYNWYLWHPVFVIVITRLTGNTATGVLIYLILSFAMAVGSTIFIEERFLSIRNNVLNTLFHKQNNIRPS